MNKNAVLYGLAVALWAMVGTFVAISVNPYWWWTGLIAGAFVGYLATDFRQMRSAATQAWTSTTSWRLNRAWWRERLQFAFCMFNLVLCFAPAFALLIAPIWIAGDHQNPYLFAIGYVAFAASVTCLMTLIVIYTESEKTPWLTIFKYNMVFMYALFFRKYSGIAWRESKEVVVLTFQALASFFRSVPTFIAATCKFTTTFFRLIHSQKRVLRAMDAGTAVLLAYFLESGTSAVLLSGVAGFLIGFLHYELISVRLLKIVPNGKLT